MILILGHYIAEKSLFLSTFKFQKQISMPLDRFGFMAYQPYINQCLIRLLYYIY